MKCSNCGTELKEGEEICPFCQRIENPIMEQNVDGNNKYEEYKETEKLNEKYGFNKLLILSIIETICCSQPFGIAALVLIFLKLKPAIEERDLLKVENSGKIIRTVLIVGLILGLIANLLYIGGTVISTFLEMASELQY